MNGTMWSPDEDRLLVEQYKKGGAPRVARETGRTLISVYHRARRLGLSTHRPWSEADDRVLRNWWGEFAAVSIARKLGRTGDAVVWRARHIGLSIGPGDGMEYLSHAAERAGVADLTMRRILEWAGVEIKRTMSRPHCIRKSKRRCLCVDTVLADQAVEDWLKSEWLESAARARGISAGALATRLGAIGVVRPQGTPWRIPMRPTSAHWRVPTVLIERAVRVSPQKLRRLKSERMSKSRNGRPRRRVAA
jgi:hypothetical protein